MHSWFIHIVLVVDLACVMAWRGLAWQVIEDQVPPFGLYIVLEFVDGGTLMVTKMNPLDPSASPQFYAPHSRAVYSEPEASRIFR